MIPCSGFIEEVLSVDANADIDADAGRIPLACHPPSFSRVTKNSCYNISFKEFYDFLKINSKQKYN